MPADVFSATSFELRRGFDVERWNMLHPCRRAVPYVLSLSGRVVLSSQPPTTCTVPDQIRQWVLGIPRSARTATTQRRARRRGRTRYIAVAALKALADEGMLDVATVKSAIRFGIDPDSRTSYGLTEHERGQPGRGTVPDIGDYKTSRSSTSP